MSVARLTSAAPRDPSSTRTRAWDVALCNVLLGPVSVLIVAAILLGSLRGPVPAFDFRFAYWSAGHRVLAGQSPYLWTAAQYRAGIAFVYPALSAVMFAPAAMLPRGVAALISTFVSLGLAPAILWVTGVRDWRVYGIAMLWLPVCGGWLTANESLFLTLGLAITWRCRDRPAAAGLLTAVVISLKPVMWPLLLWLIATRRWRASAYTLAFSALLNLAAWWLIGFNQIGAYLHATSVDTDDAWATGFGLPALLGHLGATRTTGLIAMLIMAGALVAGVGYCGLIRRNETEALTLTVALALVASPLVWGHYLTLLLVPLALLRPRLNWLWVLPVLMWVAPPDVRVHLWQAVFFWLTGGLMLTVLVADAGDRHISLRVPSWRRLPQVQA